MAHTLLLVSERTTHVQPLRRIIHELRFDVVDVVAASINDSATCIGGVVLPFTLAVLDMPVAELEAALPSLKRRKLASKLLALVPFEGQGLEAHLVKLGADDVLALPVTRPRLEVTLRNLMRLHEMEMSNAEGQLSKRQTSI